MSLRTEINIHPCALWNENILYFFHKIINGIFIMSEMKEGGKRRITINVKYIDRRNNRVRKEKGWENIYKT